MLSSESRCSVGSSTLSDFRACALFLATLSLSASWKSVEAQALDVSTAHPAFPADRKFAADDRRNNWCETQLLVHSGQIGIRDALKGRNVTFLLREAPNWVDVEDSHAVTGGFHATILEELAERAGFSWRHSFALVEGPDVDTNETWTDWTVWGVSHYDVVGEVLIDNHLRREQQIGWAGHLLDESSIIVTTVTEEDAPLILQLFSWASPFHWSVWVVLLAAMAAASLVYRQIEQGYNTADFPEDSSFVETLGHSFFLTFSAFTGAGGYAPQTWMGRTFTLVWSFSMLLITSAYTANLASLIIVDKTEKFGINSITDAQNYKLRLCVRSGTIEETIIRNYYPTIPVDRRDTIPRILEAVRNQECVGAVMTKMEWDIHQGREESNTGCKLQYG